MKNCQSKCSTGSLSKNQRTKNSEFIAILWLWWTNGYNQSDFLNK